MKKTYTKSDKKDISVKTYISIGLMLAAVITVVYYMFGPSEGYLHSDCVDTMTWAGATIDSGKLFSETFNYPYLLPFGSTFFVYPFMLVMGFTMAAYRTAMLAFMICLGVAIYFTARGMKWSRNSAFIAVAAELIIVSSSGKLRELFWEHIIHYSLGAFLAFVLIALAFAFINNYEKSNFSFKNNKKLTAITICMALWAFFSAFDGLTTLTLSTVPFAAAIVLYMVFDIKNKIVSDSNKSLAVTLGIIVIATVLGGIGLSAAAGDIASNYGDAYSVIVDRSEWSTNLMKFLEQWSSLLGADYKSGKAITDVENILAAVKMAGSLVLVCVPVYAIFVYNKFNKNEKIYIIFHWLMSGFILYGYVFGNLSSVNWRLSPIICSALIVNMMVWKLLWNSDTLKRAAVIVSSLVVLSCTITVGQIIAMPSDYGMDNDHHKAVELLKKYNLNYGYATYWNANILTLISSSEVEVRDVNFDKEYPREGWLNSDKEWYKSQPGQDKYFVLFSNSEYEDRVEEDHIILQNTSRVIKEGNWVVLVKDQNIF